MSDEVEEALEAYRRDQEVPPSLTALVEVALREYLSQRGYLASSRALRITPAENGSGRSDVSVEHDRYLTEG